MYPFFWTSRERGNFMRYSYEFRLKCVEEHRKGRYSETPEGVSEESFRSKIRQWHRIADKLGEEALMHKSIQRAFSANDKLNLICQVLSGKSCMSVAIEAGLDNMK